MQFLKKDAPIHIAVVDDDSLDVEILQAYLAEIKEFQTVLHIFHEWEAASAALEGMDLLILDFYLGHHTALGILRHLREIGNDIPIIVLTGNEDSQMAARIIKNGADDYLAKGQVDSDTLQRSIYNILERWYLRREQKRLLGKMHTLQRMEAMGTMASGIAHDFNNILSPIMGYAEMLLMDADQNEILSNGLNEILSAAKRAKELVHQIMTFSRRSEQEIAPMQMHIVVNEAIKLMKATLPSTIQMAFTLDKENDLIMGDPTQIHQVLMNLMTNAYHAMEKSGGDLTITLTCDTLPDMMIAGEPVIPGRYVHLCVTDTGEGIPQDLIDRVFEPYFTTKKEGKGTGLGMAVVHGIVKSLHGFISIQSQQKKGTAVHIHIPLLERQPHGTDSAPPLEAYYQGKGRVLIVDDELSIVRMEKKMVERMGYQVTAISNSKDALTLFQTDPYGFDLIITDYTMPGMTGTQLATAMLTIRPHIPVVICTGFNEQISPESVEKIGIRHFLMKPIDHKTLSMILHNTIENDSV